MSLFVRPKPVVMVPSRRRPPLGKPAFPDAHSISCVSCEGVFTLGGREPGRGAEGDGMRFESLARHFDQRVRQRGAIYAQQGRVSQLLVQPTAVQAVVRGSELYCVSLRRMGVDAGWHILASCACPYEDLCKHVWAVVIKALPTMEAMWGGARGPVTIETDWEAEAPVAAASRAPVFKPPSKPRRPRTPEWQRLLQETHPHEWMRRPRETAGTEPIVGRVWYVIDAPRSRQGESLVLALMRDPDGGSAGPTHHPQHPAANTARLRKLSLLARDVEHIVNPDDRAICAMLVGAGRPGREYDPFGNHFDRHTQGASLWKVDPCMAGVLMPMLQETGRLCWRHADDAAPRPARWVPERPWRLGLELHDRERVSRRSPVSGRAPDRSTVLAPCVLSGEQRLPLSEVSMVTGGTHGLVLHEGDLAPLMASRTDLQWCLGLGTRPAVRVEREELGDLLAKLSEFGLALEVAWPEAWGVHARSDVPPRGRLTLRSRGQAHGLAPSGSLHADVEYLYDHTCAGEGAGAYVRVPEPDGTLGLVRRDLAREQRLGARVLELGGKRDAYGGRLVVPIKRAGLIATALLREGWEVLGEKGVYRLAGEVNIKASSGIDWFEIRGGVSFGEASASIGAVLEALGKGEGFVTLGDGSLGMLPENWLRSCARWFALGRVEGDGVRFSKAQVSVVDALLAQLPAATCDAQVAAARERLKTFDGIAPRREPVGFRGSLRHYQRDGLGWMDFLGKFGLGGCLADDMGLGKTVQVLAHILDQRSTASAAAGPKARIARKQRAAGSAPAAGSASTAAPWLVVAPKSLVFNWAREAERFAPGLRVLAHTGPERGDQPKALTEADLVLTTYATMRLDVQLLREIEFEGVVLDEAQAIKNPASHAAKAARLLRARRRLALTGTPVENRIDDLWSIFEFLNPGMLGSLPAFQIAVRTSPAGKGEMTPAGSEHSAPPGRPEAVAVTDSGAELLRRVLRPFMLRRTKAAVAPDLPARSEQTVSCELEGKQKDLYNSLRKRYQAQLLGRVERDGMSHSRIHVLEALLRLRQAACHPALIEPKLASAESSKVSTLVEMLEELTQEGHKALVFSQFTSLLGLVRATLDDRKIAYEYLDGKTTTRERVACIDRFQSDASPGVFLISLKAGGTGLNLTSAGYVFLLDPWWNPAVEAQAIDRTHRIGQDKSIIAYRLIARGTVEERILELQSTKRELAEAIVTENQGPLASMTADDLAWLLS